MGANQIVDVLPTFAEISVALAGFANIVVLFRRGRFGRSRKADVDRYFGRVVTASLAVFFSLLPLVLRAKVSRDPLDPKRSL